MAKTQKGSATSRRRVSSSKSSAGRESTADLSYGRIEPGRQPTSYFPTTKEEVEFIGTVVVSGWKAGKSVLEYFRKAAVTAPLAVSVVRSEPTAGGYRVDFQFANTSPNSLYIEDLLVLDPHADADEPRIRPLDFSIHDTTALDKRQPGPPIALGSEVAGGAKGTAEARKPTLPLLVRREDKPELSLLVPSDAKQWFDKAKMGIARARVSFLGDETPQSVAWQFMIRHK